MTQTKELYARLSKDRRRVLCFAPRCGGVLGEVDAVGQARDVLLLLPGWAPDSRGVWKLSNYARRRMKKGHRPQLRDRFKALVKGYTISGDVNEFQKAAAEIMYSMVRKSLREPFNVQLPVTAECLKCAKSQVLSAERLKVLPTAYGLP
jgi:hypothetical protein